MPDDVKKPKRKYLREEFSELADVVEECAKNLKKTCEAIAEPDSIHKAYMSVSEAETKGDVVRDRVLASFALEKHPPVLQLDRIELLKDLDKIANKTEHAARVIDLSGNYFPKKYLKDLLDMMDIVLDIVKAVSKGTKVIFDSFKDAADVVHEVEKSRDKTRDLMFELQGNVLKDQEVNDHQALFAVDKISTTVQQVAERAKETADLIEVMKLKFL